MKKGLCVLAVLALLLGKAGAQEASLMAGKLLGHDGKPMLKAHVHLLPREYDRKALQSVDVGKDGRFEMKITDTGLRYLHFTGVNHHELMVPLLIEKPVKEKLTVQLKLYEYSDDLSQVKIIGDFNNFDFGSARPMTKESDGTYTFEMDASAATFTYQLLGAEKTGRSINGTQSEEFVYDGGGDYQSVVKVSGGKARVVLDPAKLLRARSGDEAVVRFDDAGSFQAKLYAFHSAQQKRQAQFSAAALAYREAHNNDMTGFSFDWSTQLAEFQKTIASERRPAVRQLLLIYYLQFGNVGAYQSLDKNVVKQALEEIPATSPLWSMSTYMIWNAVSLSGEKDKYEAYLNEAMERHADRGIRAMLLGMKLGEATRKGDQAAVSAYYQKLKTEYGDVREAEFALRRYDPNRAINTGKPVPVFSVASLEQPAATYTNESFAGKVYLLDFWAVWCGPCVGEMPNLHKAYEKFKDKNFEILSLSFDAKPEDVTKFRNEKWKMPWLHTFVEKGFLSDLAKTFEVAGIPKPILVDGNTNTIIATENDLRGERLEQTLTEVFAARTVGNSAAKP